jgi:hypothetical protein
MDFKLGLTARGTPRRFFPSRHDHSEGVIAIAQKRKSPVFALSGDECIAIW